jgi:hypothetical protein
MTTVYCCYNDTTFIDSHNSIDDANSCCTRRRRTQANINLLANAGVISQLITPELSYMFNQYNFILGITDENITTEYDTLTNFVVHTKSVS